MLLKIFKPAERQERISIEKISKKEENKMGLSLGTWVMLIIVMVVVAKVAHKLSLKTIFRPTKKATTKIKKDWEEA